MFGLPLPGDDFVEMAFGGCKCVLMIEETSSKLKAKFGAKRENTMIDDGSLLVLARAWSKQADREKIISQIGDFIGDSFANEFILLSEHSYSNSDMIRN